MISMKLFIHEKTLYDVHLNVDFANWGPTPNAYKIDKILFEDTGEELDKNSPAFVALSEMAITDHIKDVEDSRAYMAKAWARDKGKL